MAKIHDQNSEECRLGKQIQKYRKLRGLTQSQLADILDMDRANVASYENGAKGEMGFKTLLRFSRALGVSVDTLLEMEEDTLINKTKQLSIENREVVKTVIEGLLHRQRYTT